MADLKENEFASSKDIASIRTVKANGASSAVSLADLTQVLEGLLFTHTSQVTIDTSICTAETNILTKCGNLVYLQLRLNFSTPIKGRTKIGTFPYTTAMNVTKPVTAVQVKGSYMNAFCNMLIMNKSIYVGDGLTESQAESVVIDTAFMII